MVFARFIVPHIFFAFFLSFGPCVISDQCSRSESSSVKMKTSEVVAYRTKCGRWWSRYPCSKYKTVYSDKYVIQYGVTYRENVDCNGCQEWYFCQRCVGCRKCQCNNTNSISCNTTDGSCMCKDGWHGDQCEDRCERGKYGDHCQSECTCQMNNTVSCDHLDGNCLCKSGWTGKTCNEKVKEPCLPGRYGENCEEMCECMTNTTRRCDQFNGTCYCDIGWTGTDCSEPIVDGFEQTGDSTNSVAIAVIVLVGVIAVIVFIVLFIILRRRKTNGKQIFWRFCRGRRHSNSDGGAADVDDTIQYANIVSSTSEEETSNQTGSKLAVYAVVDKKKHGKKTEALDKEMHDDLTATESGKGRLDNKSETEGAADVSNSPQALDLTYNEVDRTGKLYRPNTAGSDVGYDSLKPDVSEGIADYTSCPREQLDDDNRYDGLDHTGKAYRPERVTVTTDSEYDRLTAEDSVNPGTTDEYSIAAEPGMVDEYSSIDRTGKDYRLDTETNYDKLRMN